MGKLKRPYRPWTEAESERLAALVAAGLTKCGAARALDREVRTVGLAAARLGLTFAAFVPRRRVRAPRPPDAPYPVTLDEVVALLRVRPMTALAIAQQYASDLRRVNGLLATLLRQGLVSRPTTELWQFGDIGGDELTAPVEPHGPVEQERSTYQRTKLDSQLLARLHRERLRVCGACEHYSGPLAVEPGHQLRGRCLVLAVWVLPHCDDAPCGSYFSMA